jgi:hypothetical protein
MNFIKATTIYEVEVNGNKYQFQVPAGAPLGEAYDVVFKFLSIIADQAKASAESLKPKEAPSTNASEVKSEVS